MAAKIEQRPATGTFHIPKPLRVWPEMFLALLNQVQLSECAVVGHLFGLDVFRCKEKLFGVKQQDATSATGFNHGVSLIQRDAQRLLADHMLACASKGQSHLTMESIRGSNGD